MNRPLLDSANVHPSAREKIACNHEATIREIETAMAAHDVVVVGMAVNPFPRKARALLTEHKIAFHYLEYGSYFGEWRKRTAIKMWSGWPTFPMVFVKGTLIGGFTDLEKLVASGEIRKMLGTT
jgi:monothiol glutaredoxin